MNAVVRPLLAACLVLGLVGFVAAPASSVGLKHGFVHQFDTGLNPERLDFDEVDGLLFAVAEGAPAFGQPPRLTIVPTRTRGASKALDLAEYGDVVYSGKNDTVYVAQPNARTILAIDPTTATVRETISVLGSAVRLDVDPGLDRLYGISDVGNLLVVDTTSDRLARIVPIPRAFEPQALAVNLANHEVYVDRGAPGAPAVEVVDGVALRVVDYVVVDRAIDDLAMSPTSDVLYALGATLSLIDAKGHFVWYTRPAAIHGDALDVDSRTGTLYIADRVLGHVLVVEPKAGGVWHETVTDIPTKPSVVQYDPVTDEILVGGHGSYAVDVLGVVSPAVFDTASLPSAKKGVAYDAGIIVSGTPAPKILLSAGSLPPGLVLAPKGVTGVPTKEGSYTFTLAASNGVGPVAYKTYTIVVAP